MDKPEPEILEIEECRDLNVVFDEFNDSEFRCNVMESRGMV